MAQRKRPTKTEEDPLNALVVYLRNALRRKGTFGRWLLEQIDTETSRLRQERVAKKILGPEQALAAIDVLRVFADVLRAYLVDLPSSTEAFAEIMQKAYKIDDVQMAMPDSDTLISFADLYPPEWAQLVEVFDEISELLAARD